MRCTSSSRQDRWVIRAGWVASLAIVVAMVFPGFLDRGPTRLVPALAATPIASPQSAQQAPLLAYYQLWFQTSSWNVGKTDRPVLGGYSSDDETVMRTHIRWAKAVGIDGFIVVWKSTEVLDARLDLLVRIASEEKFKLAIAFEGLDAQGRPLDAAAAGEAFTYFAGEYGDNKVFDLFGRPLVVLIGSQAYSRAAIAQITQGRRDRLLILASESDASAYGRIADLVDGDAYRWSSGDPVSTPGYDAALSKLATAVHAHGGLWIAPATPGYDARAVGGERVVERRNGDTLRKALVAAMASGPDAIGLLSWNDFGENTQVEPSCVQGITALEVIAAFRGATAPSDVPACAAGTPAPASRGSPIAGTPISAFSGTPVLGTPVVPSSVHQAVTPVPRLQRPEKSDANPGFIIVVLLGLLGCFALSLTMISRRGRPGHAAEGPPIVDE
jgi:hypothetical protein